MTHAVRAQHSQVNLSASQFSLTRAWLLCRDDVAPSVGFPPHDARSLMRSADARLAAADEWRSNEQAAAEQASAARIVMESSHALALAELQQEGGARPSLPLSISLSFSHLFTHPLTHLFSSHTNSN
eukprot:COSAG05_NODE_504_length_9208_cov_22.420024_5_plen_127_part_00